VEVPARGGGRTPGHRATGRVDGGAGPWSSASVTIRQTGGAAPWILLVLLLAVALPAGYVWTTLTWSFSEGERVGYLQKFSKRGWVCKTWEGEIAMVTMPGAIPEKFYFSTRDDAVAAKLNGALGKRVGIVYQQHVGIPTSCFGETEYFVSDVKSIQE